MSFETQLFYWSGWFALTTIMLSVGLIIAIKVLWFLVNTFEDAFTHNAALLVSYLLHLYKYRYKGIEQPNDEFESSMIMGDYNVTVEAKKVEKNE